MNRAHLLVLGASVMLATRAWAVEPAPPDGQSLGMIEAILERCAQLDPAAADRYRHRLGMLTQGVNEEVLAEVRQGDEYRQSRDAIAESLGGVTDADAGKACTGFLAENR